MLKAVLKLVTLSFFLWLPQGHAAIAINSARVWPAQDYTRLTLESKQAIRHNMFNLSNPERLVIDLEEVELGNALNDLAKLIGNDDPYIKSVRVGRFKPGVVRLVLDLKSEAKPQLFVLKPVAEYGYRPPPVTVPNPPPIPISNRHPLGIPSWLAIQISITAFRLAAMKVRIQPVDATH